MKTIIRSTLAAVIVIIVATAIVALTATSNRQLPPERLTTQQPIDDTITPSQPPETIQQGSRRILARMDTIIATLEEYKQLIEN